MIVEKIGRVMGGWMSEWYADCVDVIEMDGKVFERSWPKIE